MKSHELLQMLIILASGETLSYEEAAESLSYDDNQYGSDHLLLDVVDICHFVLHITLMRLQLISSKET